MDNDNIKEVIGKWLSDPKNNWNDITDFLIDDLGIKVNLVDEEEEEIFVCDCGEEVEDKNRCNDCGYCCNPAKPHRCCECM